MLKRLIGWMQGRSTLFAVYFAIVGTIMAWFGHLSMEYVALIGAIQGLVIAHSAKEDYFAQKNNPPKDAPVVDNGGDNGSTK